MASRLRQPPESAAASALRSAKPARPDSSRSRPSRSVSFHVRRGQRLLQNLADGKAGGKARVLRHVGGAGALAHGQLA